MKLGRPNARYFAFSVLIALLVTFMAARVFAELTIHVIDVGQADACLIISPTGGTMLIDAGDNGDGSSIVVPYLQTYGLQALDYIVATHYHSDHIGGIDEVVSYLGIDSVRVAVYDRGWSYNTQTYSDYAAAVAAKRATITDGQVTDLGGGVTLTCVAVNGNGVLSPPFDTQYNENDLSVSLVLEYDNGFRFFTGGDLSGRTDGEYHDIETSVAPEVGAVDVYRVNHHGSFTSSNATFVSTLLPAVSVISLGDGNPYGYVHQEVMDRLIAYGSNVYQTEAGVGATIPPGRGRVVNGDIVVEVDSTFYTVDVTDFYELGDTGIPISAVRENDEYGQPMLLAEPVILRGVATVPTGTFSTLHNDIYIQDGTGGVNVYLRNSTSPTVALGDSLKVSGLVDQYRGLTRITSPTITVEDTGLPVPEPVVLTTAFVDSGGEDYEGSLVKVVGAAITGGTWPGEGADGSVTVDDGSGECTIYISRYTDIDGTPQPAGYLDIVGVLTQYDASSPYFSGYRIQPRFTADIDSTTSGVPGADVERDANLIARVLPNPARGSLRITFGAGSVAADRQVAFYDLRGRKVAGGEALAGERFFDWNAEGLASGIYFAVVTSGAERATAKIVLID
ncbi:MAG: MBL fold metallo-hydrolase [bacterium]|jgi:beta-lactamase superfamily II metal-dependent hydrolase